MNNTLVVEDYLEAVRNKLYNKKKTNKKSAKAEKNGQAEYFLNKKITHENNELEKIDTFLQFPKFEDTLIDEDYLEAIPNKLYNEKRKNKKRVKVEKNGQTEYFLNKKITHENDKQLDKLEKIDTFLRFSKFEDTLVDEDYLEAIPNKLYNEKKKNKKRVKAEKNGQTEYFLNKKITHENDKQLDKLEKIDTFLQPPEFEDILVDEDYLEAVHNKLHNKKKKNKKRAKAEKNGETEYFLNKKITHENDKQLDKLEKIDTFLRSPEFEDTTKKKNVSKQKRDKLTRGSIGKKKAINKIKNYMPAWNEDLVNPVKITHYGLTIQKNNCSETELLQRDLNIVKDIDTFANDNISVKSLKFNRFCAQYIPIYNELYLRDQCTLHIPEKYFKSYQNDLSSDNTVAPKNVEIDSDQNKNSSHRINILDIKIIKPQTSLKSDTVENQVNITGDNVTENNDCINNLNDIFLTEVLNLSTESKVIDLTEECIPTTLKLANDNILVIVNPETKAFFFGLATIEVIYGEIDILGAIINRFSGIKKIYSPRGSSLLYIKNNRADDEEILIHLEDIIEEELLPQNTVCVCKKNSAIVLCKELEETYIEFIENHISQKIFPEDITSPRIDFLLKGTWNKLRISEAWKDTLQNMLPESKAIIAGGKGVGKSTFIRYAVNTCLQKFKTIRVIDLDPGQSEFIPPGAISVVTVREELLGPNYTHLQTPDYMILSHINIGFDIEKYLHNVKILLVFARNLPPLPTLINLPGFTAGLGLDIALNIISLVEPDILIQINSKIASKNYKFDLTLENVTQSFTKNNIVYWEAASRQVDLKYQHIPLASLSESNEAWSMEARQNREINILSYFGQMVPKDVKTLGSSNLNMYRVNISSFSITNSVGENISPLAINANIVMLCSLLNFNIVTFAAYGYGFVRGVDIQNDTLIILTPEPVDLLEEVSHLVLSSVTIPPSLLMTATDVKGLIPYISIGELIDFGQFTKRSYLPPKK